jgi:outer membrane lipoprotein
MQIPYVNALLLMTVPLLAAVGCNGPRVIPEQLEGEVDRNLRFAEVKDNPNAYRGQLMLAGGEVLSITAFQNGTRMTVLQRPLSSELVPQEDEDSLGRFVAMDVDKHVIDPAVLKDNAFVTVVGEVMGSDRIRIDEVKDEVPTLRVKHVTVWDRDRSHPSYGYLYPYTYGYSGYYGYPLRW